MSDLFKTLLIDRPRVYGTDGAGLLEEANNLSDVADVTTARSNLGVYSTGETNTRLNALAPRQGVQITQQLANTDAATSLLLTNPDAFTLYWEGVITRYPTASSTQPLIGNARGTATVNTGTFSLACRQTGEITARNDISGVDFESKFFGYTAPLNTPLSLALTLDKATRVTRLFVNGVQVGGDQTFDSLTITSTTVSVKLMSAVQADIDAGRNVNGVTYRAGILNFAAPATTTSGVVGVAERYASGVWVQPSERAGVNTLTAAVGYDFLFATDTGAASNSKYDFTNTDSGSAGRQRPFFALPVRGGTVVEIKISGYAKSAGTTGLTLLNYARNAVLSAQLVITGDGVYRLTSTGADSTGCAIQLNNTGAAGTTTTADIDYVKADAATLDLTPIGVGRVLIDRSASRNHAIVSGTVHPTYLQPAESGRIIATTNLATNQQLLALSAFDAANKYRITSWTVTSTGTPTISLGNASAGTQYVNGLTLVANTPTAVTLATSIAATANLWCNSSTTDPVTHVITYERIDA
jgi:hypothetical protein